MRDGTPRESGQQSIEVTRTYLQLLSQAQFVPAFLAETHVRLDRVTDCPVSLFRTLYREVGRSYHWVDRLEWTDDQIQTYLSCQDLELWVMYDGISPAGYFELLRHEDDSVEIAYFGLLPKFIGRGLGKHLLSCAVGRAWAAGANRVWLHTCTLDDPAALPNYRKRGFAPFKQEKYFAAIAPDEGRGWERPLASGQE